MHKKILTILAVLPTFLVPSALIFAQGVVVSLKNPIGATSTAEVLNAFFKILVQIGAVAVTLAIVYAGFMFVVAQGRPEQLKTAKVTLFWTIIGAMVLLGAQLIASVIEQTIKEVGAAEVSAVYVEPIKGNVPTFV